MVHSRFARRAARLADGDLGDDDAPAPLFQRARDLDGQAVWSAHVATLTRPRCSLRGETRCARSSGQLGAADCAANGTIRAFGRRREGQRTSEGEIRSRRSCREHVGHSAGLVSSRSETKTATSPLSAGSASREEASGLTDVEHCCAEHHPPTVPPMRRRAVEHCIRRPDRDDQNERVVAQPNAARPSKP